MRTTWKTGLVTLGCAVAACSGRDTSEAPRRTAAALEIPNQMVTPRPIRGGVLEDRTWQGTTVDLMFADAWAACAYTSETAQPDEADLADLYEARIAREARGLECAAAAPPSGPSDVAKYTALRQTPACNLSTLTGQPLGIAIGHEKTIIKDLTGLANGDAQRTVRRYRRNLCVAQRLRNANPGAAGGASLLLTPTEHRQLLEVIRERAQVAMLGYASLGVAFASGPTWVPPWWDTVLPDRYVDVLQQWGQDPANAGELRALGTDFATAVQLHATATEELAEMMTRAAAVHAPRGGSPSGRADDDWGPASWRQRLLALLYGGDPQAMPVGTATPWVNMAGAFAPGLTYPAATTAGAWPAREELPFLSTPTPEPEVQQLRALAQAFDVLEYKPLSGECGGVNEATSASRLYRAVEARLRTAACATRTSNGCVVVDPDAVSLASADVDTLLWKQYRIKLAHANTVVRHLSEVLGCADSSGNERLGGFNVGGRVALVRNGTDTWLRLPKGASTEPLGLAQLQPMFTRNARFRTPSRLFSHALASSQGFDLPGEKDDFERKRRAGAVAALEAVRQAVASSVASRPGAPVTGTYFEHTPEILRFVGAAIGNTGVALDPSVTEGGAAWVPVSTVTVSPDGSSASGSVTYGSRTDLAQVPASGGRLPWTLRVIVPSDDPFWSTSGGATLEVFAVPNDASVGNLALIPSARFVAPNGTEKTLATARWGAGTVVGTPAVDADLGYTAPLRRWATTLNLALGSRWTFVASRSSSTSGGVRLLAAGVDLSAKSLGDGRYGTTDGQYWSLGDGRLNGLAQRAFARASRDPSKPRFDGFGLPTDAQPPADPTLYGGQPGEDVLPTMLRKAKESAVEATDAVKRAYETMLDEARDQAAMSAAVTKSAEVTKLGRQELCGGTNTKCNTAYRTRSVTADELWLSARGTPFVRNCASPGSTDEQIDCSVYELLRSLAVTAQLADSVLSVENAAVQPAFEAYSGGSLQPVLVEQWASLARLRNRAKEVFSAADAAKARVAAANAVLRRQEDEASYACSPTAFGLAMQAGVGVSAGFPAGASGSFSFGPFVAQVEKCRASAAGLSADRAQAAATIQEALTSIVAQTTQFADAATAIQRSSAQGLELLQRAELAQRREDVEKKVLALTQTTSFGVYRRFHSLDAWRARALLENARRYAVAARRAIELRYVVDLGALTGNEAYVTSPATWADDIFDYDLSMPSSVGLSVTQTTDGIYPNRVLDYVGDLERFVHGFAVTRPSAAAQEDAEVLTLPGPNTLASDGASSNTWLFQCDNGWRALREGQGPDTVCDASARPTRARLSFALDPWARVNGSLANEPYTRRFNVRWARLAVNLVGTGVVDCQRAADAMACYSQPFTRYSLTHVGPVWVTGYDQQWRAFDLAAGQIEGAKALAAEQWLDPLGNGFPKPYVGAITRTELSQRPVGGVYTLDLPVGPELRLDRIERVQLLSGTTYWVKQQ